MQKFPAGFRLTGNVANIFISCGAEPFVDCVAKNKTLPDGRRGSRACGSANAAEAKPDGEEQLGAVVSALATEQQDVLLLRFVDDLSLEEIGTTLGIPTGTVKSRLHNALAALRRDPRTKKYFGL